MLFDRFDVIDVDTHITEPPDTWLGRMPVEVGRRDPAHRAHRRLRRLGHQRPAATPSRATRRWPASTARCPTARRPTTTCTPRRWDPKARLAFMDEQDIHAQVLYPNVGGFGAGAWLDKGEPAYALDCVRAYNDFQIDFCIAAPNRLLPMTSMPFWDVDATVAEIERCVAQRPPRRELLQPARRPTTSRRLGRSTGTRSGRRRRTPACRSASTSAAAHIGELMSQGIGDGLPGELLAHVVDALHRQPALHRRPDLRRRLPPLPRAEVRVGGERRRQDPRRARGDRLAVAQRRRRQGAPRVRPAAVGVLPPPDLRLLLVRAQGRDPGARSPTPTTCCSRPTSRTRPASTPARRPRPSSRGSTPRRRSACCPTTCCRRCWSTTPPRSTA